jgi:hypothetical protein
LDFLNLTRIDFKVDFILEKYVEMFHPNLIKSRVEKFLVNKVCFLNFIRCEKMATCMVREKNEERFADETPPNPL